MRKRGPFAAGRAFNQAIAKRVGLAGTPKGLEAAPKKVHMEFDHTRIIIRVWLYPIFVSLC
jgi:hypothetical protein